MRGKTKAGPECPECAQGKCINCAHAALDEKTEDIVSCACEDRGHVR